MTTSGDWRLPARTVLLTLLLLVALDSLAMGAWAVMRPDDLFGILGMAPPRDAVLWRCLGAVGVAHAVFLGMLVVWPEAFGPLVLVPLIGRCLSLGGWLFLLGTDRVRLPATPLGLLAAHDAAWLGVLVAFLIVWYRARPSP